MAYPASSLPTFIPILVLLLVSIHKGFAVVPVSKTFKLVNNGGFSKYTAEFNSQYRALPISAFPFRLCFFNTTPNAFTLAIGMGDLHSQFGIKWVWYANRGRPVKDNAVLSLAQDGNLILRDSDGSIAWQTGTSSRNVAGLSLLSNGNLVLTDGNGNSVWQSFNFPTDSLLPGQYIFRDGRNKLTGRVSDKDGSEGPFSFQLENNHCSLFYTVKGKPLRYFKSSDTDSQETIANSTVTINQNNVDENSYEIGMTGANPFLSVTRPKFNATYSFLRMEAAGNLAFYSFKEKVRTNAWEITRRLFDRDDFISPGECQLPTKCGNLGVCSGNQCVGCPQQQGFLGWRSSCSAPALPACGAPVNYYQVQVNVDHFLSGYNDGVGPISLADCRGRCSKDCGCLGFFYNKNSTRCFLAPILGSLIQVDDPDHVGFIKTS